MNSTILFPLSLLLLCISCGRQNHSANATGGEALPIIARHDTVSEMSNNIMVVYQDRNDHYWFASWEDGLYRYDGKTILHFSSQSGLPDNRVEEIREDEQGNIFFNTSKGLCKFDGNKFTTLRPVESSDWKLEPGDLWFKSPQYDAHVYRYDGLELHHLTLPKTEVGEDWIKQHPGYTNPYPVYTIYNDSKGNVWFGTAAVGALRYNGSSFDWISEEDVTELHDGPANGVRSIIEDKDGNFWFNSAYRYNVYGHNNEQGQPFYVREKSIGNLESESGRDSWEYMSIAKDNNNHLWMSTYLSGVFRFDGESVTHYRVQSDGEDITLFSIYKDNNGRLWLGTHENGVYVFNGTSFERFRRQAG